MDGTLGEYFKARGLKRYFTGRLADRLCIGSLIAGSPFTAAYSKISKFGGAQAVGAPEASAGRAGFFCKVQGRARTPGRCRFHLPVGQPLASARRSASSGSPFLGLMRCGPWGARRTRHARAEPCAGRHGLGRRFAMLVLGLGWRGSPSRGQSLRRAAARPLRRS